MIKSNTTKRPKRPKLAVAEMLAKLFLVQHGITSPPTPAKMLASTIAKLKYFYNHQERTFIHEKGISYPTREGYVICINRDLPDNGMDTFTYAHEIGHIVLRHHIDYDVDNLTNYEYWVLDREADCFAANILMPVEWLKQKLPPRLMTVQTLGRLKNEFAVSWEALINRLHDLKICRRQQIQEMFFVWNCRNRKQEFPNNYCTSSREETSLMMPTFCMLLPEIDKNMRFVSCPSCGNKDISKHAKYCKKCGDYLYNLCSNFPEENIICGERNDSDALFCEYCGAETMLKQLMDRVECCEVAATLEED